MKFECLRHSSGHILLPAQFINEDYKIKHDLKFLIDTGAAVSIISYQQAIQWHLNFDKLKKTEEPGVFGGGRGYGFILKNNHIILSDYSDLTLGIKSLRSFKLHSVVVLGPDYANTEPLPCVLGYDFLKKFTLLVHSEKRGGKIILTDDQIPFE